VSNSRLILPWLAGWHVLSAFSLRQTFLNDQHGTVFIIFFYRGERIKLDTPDRRSVGAEGMKEFGNFGVKDFESQQIMQELSDG